MSLSGEYKGYGLALLSYLSQATGAICSKLLINASSVETTSVFWFAAGTVMSFGILQFWREGVRWASLRENLGVYLKISLVMTAAAIGWFIGIKYAGPGIVAFVQQLGIVMSVLLGAFILRERMTLLDGLGTVLAIGGALVISYRSGDVVLWGIAATLVNAVGVSIQHFWVKRHVETIDKFELLFVRSVVALVGIVVFYIALGGFEMPKWWLVPGFFVGSGVGYVLFNLLIYFALSFADLAKISVLRVVSPPLAMLGAYLVLNSVPTPTQVLGGIFILLGISLILLQPMFAREKIEQDWSGSYVDNIE